MSNPDLREELGIGLSGPGLKITAEGVRDQSCHGCYLLQVDLLGEMPETIVIDGIDAVVLRSREVVAEADGGKGSSIRVTGEGGQTFNETDDAVDPVGGADPGYECREGRIFTGIERRLPRSSRKNGSR